VLAGKVQAHLTEFLKDYGYSVVDSLITDIDPDGKVKSAMNMINESRRKREAAKEKAEAQKIETVVKAEADADAQYLRGKGVADQRRAIIAGMQSSVNDFKKDVEGMNEKELAANSARSTLFIPHNVGSVTELCDELHQGVTSSKKAIAF